jgi:hypothetical protein
MHFKQLRVIVTNYEIFEMRNMIKYTLRNLYDIIERTFLFKRQKKRLEEQVEFFLLDD